MLDGNLKGLRGDDSELPIEIELAHAVIDGAPHLVATIVDETDRMRREAAALAAKGAAEASERTKTQFLAHISHEIRTPLHTVIGLTEATLQTSLSATQRDHLRTVLDAGESLLNALDFLDFTRISSGSLELDQIQFDLHDTVRGTLDSLAIRAQDKGLSLSCSIDPLVPVTLIGDPARLRQVLTNLLDNAIRFTAAARSRWRSSWRRPTATDTRSCTSRCATPGRASPRSSSTGSSSRSSRSIHRRCGAVARGSGSRSVSSSSS